jgi:hypothetical protein
MLTTQRRNIQMDVIRKLKETGDKDAIAALRILPAAAPLPALNQAETSAENKAVDPSSELAFMAAQIQDRTMMRVFRFIVANAGNLELEISSILSSGLPAFSTINLKARIMVLSCICAAINAILCSPSGKNTRC